MGKYSVPPQILALKPNGTMVKNKNDHYYVYDYECHRIRNGLDKDGKTRWKTVTKMGSCIGQITEEDGFVSNGAKRWMDEITVLEYGAYAYSRIISKDTFEKLKEFFIRKDAKQIYVCGLIIFNEGFTYMKDMSTKYDESVLNRFIPNIKVGYDALSELYYYLGRRTGRCVDLQQKLINNSSKEIAVDGHVIACASQKNDLSEYGYKAKKLGTSQINYMAAYDVLDDMPLASSIYNGAIPDKSALQQLFGKFSFCDCMFYVDRGFNTKSDKELMSINGNTYIVPMIRGREDYKKVYELIKFDKRRWFVYGKDGYSSTIYYQEFKGEGNIRYFAFLDVTRQDAERRTYMEKLRNGVKGYSQEGLESNEKDFGLFLLETNDISLTPEQIFTGYKKRWKIETFYDYIDNSIDFNALYQQDYCRTEGVGFIVHVAGMIYHDLRSELKKYNYSVREVMDALSGLKAVKEHSKWAIRNNNKARQTIADKIGFEIPNYI